MVSITSAIEDLYRAFGEVPKPEIIHACPCCMTADEVEILLKKPLRELTSEDLSSFASSALLTVGDIPDYLYYLPRILEISIQDEMFYPCIEISGDKIRMTEPSTWPSSRLNAVIAFFQAAIDEMIVSEKYYSIDEWMCCIAALTVDMRPFLDQIESNEGAVLEYFDANAKCLPNGKLCNPFWEEPRPGHDEIVNWFKSEAISNILFDAYGYRT